MVQWLGVQAFTTEGMGSIPGQGTKIPQTTWPKEIKKKKSIENVIDSYYSQHHSS